MSLRHGQEARRTAPGGPLTRSDPGGTGIRRRRRGRGFSYLGSDTAVIKDPQTLARIKALVIPPAWEDVWICIDPHGHIQAIGTDSAGAASTGTTTCGASSGTRTSTTGSATSGRPCRAPRGLCRHLGGRGLTRDRVLAAASG